MAKHNQSPSWEQQSVKLKAKSLKGPYFEVADFAAESDVRILSDDCEHARKKPTQSSEILSTAELISAVGQLWDSASRSLARLQPRACVHSYNVCQKHNESYYMLGNDNLQVPVLVDSRCLHVDLDSSRYVPYIVRQSINYLKLGQEISYKICDDHFLQSYFLSGHNSFIRHDVCSKESNLAKVRIPFGLLGNYKWMSLISPLLIVTTGEPKKVIETTSEVGVGAYPPGNEAGLLSNFETENHRFCIDKSNSKNISSNASATVIMNRGAPVSSLRSEYFLKAIEDTHSAASMSTTVSLQPHGDHHADIIAAGSTGQPNGLMIGDDDYLLETKPRQIEKLDTQGELQSGSCSSVTNQPHALLAKREHAVSGALAGLVVSLCLHPIDTVKTVVQSCHADQRSIRCIGQSIISERGITGLYRGITSNITTSAPISAIYTFTYESVKGFLAPSLSKEYHSIAHCTAGACASIATSFIFTPSEHIKQQMQVNSQYKNCWNAAYRIIENGGLPSLYTGWRAVLWRNIPHSIIKFYTYESLKQKLILSEKPISQPSTLHTLLCGGIAGSTAALFSTPFDVVKTRLQTQMPGAIRTYDGILGAFQDICEHDGVKGLYRGLIPRLTMYMSQGALFFASYELMKSLFSLSGTST